MTKPSLELLTYNIGEGAAAFSTTRCGVDEADRYSSFNINMYCGDSPDHVSACRQMLSETIGIALPNIIVPHQVHGTETRIISSEYLTLPQNIKDMLIDGVDAVMTNVEGVCVGVSTADCIPILLYDEDHRAVCAIHAGWRGTLGRIAHKALEEMRIAYHTEPEKLKAIIGPGISLKNFEVGDEVYAVRTPPTRQRHSSRNGTSICPLPTATSWSTWA